MRTPSRKRRSQTEMQSTKDSDDDEKDNLSVDESSSNTNIQNRKEESTQQVSHPQRGRPPKVRRDSGGLLQSPRSSRRPSRSPSKRGPSSKRRKRDEQLIQQRIQAESFIMKLFDRSLDLSKYSECTELYPICRAWMANQPRNPSIHSSKRRSPLPTAQKCDAAELLAKLKSGEIRDVTAMPGPEETELPKIPPVEKLGEQLKTEEEETPDLTNASTEELLAVHVNKWKNVKSNWLKHTKCYQQRYKLNYLVVHELYSP